MRQLRQCSGVWYSFGFSKKNRVTENLRPDVIDVDLDLNHQSDIRACGSVHRDDCLSAELTIARLPKEPGVNGSSGLTTSVIQRTIHGEFYQGNDVAEGT